MTGEAEVSGDVRGRGLAIENFNRAKNMVKRLNKRFRMILCPAAHNLVAFVAMSFHSA